MLEAYPNDKRLIIALRWSRMYIEVSILIPNGDCKVESKGIVSAHPKPIPSHETTLELSKTTCRVF